MVSRELIIEKLTSFINIKLDEVTTTSPIMALARPIASRVINNNMYKVDKFLKMLEDKDGNIDIEGILGDTVSNLITMEIQNYPDLFAGVKIGKGKIVMDIPLTGKSIEVTSNDISSFKSLFRN